MDSNVIFIAPNAHDYKWTEAQQVDCQPRRSSCSGVYGVLQSHRDWTWGDISNQRVDMVLLPIEELDVPSLLWNPQLGVEWVGLHVLVFCVFQRRSEYSILEGL